MINSLQQKIMSMLAAFFMMVLAVSTIYCVIRLQERTLQVQSLQGQRTALQAQVKDWQEKCNKLPEDQQSGEGLMIKKMGVSLVSPAADAEITDSVLVQGYANVFEGTVNLRLKDAAGRILTADLAMACMGDWPCYFEKELKFTQPAANTDAVLEVYTISAKDGSEQDLIAVALKIEGKTSPVTIIGLPVEILHNQTLLSLLKAHQLSGVTFTPKGINEELKFPADTDERWRYDISIEDVQKDAYAI